MQKGVPSAGANIILEQCSQREANTRMLQLA